MIRVGFHYNFSKNAWLGGTIYLKNLFEGINSIKNINIKPVIITDFKCTNSDLFFFKGVEVVRSKLFSRSTFNRIFNKIIIILFGKNIIIQNYLIANNIHILSHFSCLGNKSKIPSIFWQPDFQEVNNPDLISFKRKIFRKINILLMSKHANKILLSSNTVKKELKKINFRAYKNLKLYRMYFQTCQTIVIKVQIIYKKNLK